MIAKGMLVHPFFHIVTSSPFSDSYITKNRRF